MEIQDAEAPARAAYSAEMGRRGDWMQTATGGQFWPMDPRADEVRIQDIAWALSHLCRYGGHCKYFYSVAQHSVYVSQILPPALQMYGLMHDATEAYCVDVPRPIKRFLAGYSRIEAGIWRAIAERFDLPVELPPEIKVADDSVLLAEKAQVMRESPAPWCIAGEPANIEITHWTPAEATFRFLQRFQQLRGVL